MSRGPLLCVGNRRKGPSSWEKPTPGRLGFDLHRFDTATGRLDPIGTAAPEISVGAATWDPARGVLYAVDETLTLPGFARGGGGQVLAFRVDHEAGTLVEIARQPSFGTLPAMAALSQEGDFLLVVNHTGHTPVTRTERDPSGRLRIVLAWDEAATVLYPLAPDGGIEPPCDLVRHEGRGALPSQTHPQLHAVVRAPGRDLFLVCDKGADRLHLFGLDRAARRLVPKSGLAVPAGSSPRYAAFHPTLPVAYVNFETAPFLQVHGIDGDGICLLQQTPPFAAAGAMASDLLLHPGGRFLYTLVRGPECVAVHAVDPTDGTLTPLAVQPLGVENARGAAISPDGRHFLVATVAGREVRVWRLGADGRLRGDPARYPHPAPGCLAFATAGQETQ